MNAFAICDELIATKYRIPVFEEISACMIGEFDPPVDVKTKTIDLGDLLMEIRSQYMFLYNKNQELLAMKKEFRKLAENDYNIHWSREQKREILEIYFQELIPKLPYYSGGDLK